MKSIPVWIPIGQEIHGYRFDEIIGRGGYAQVYKVFSLKYQIEFVAKVMKINVQPKLNIIDAFYRETEMLRHLDHPNIIRLYDTFNFQDYFFMILEYCPGGSLQDFIHKNGCIPVSQLRVYIVQILSALAFIHSQKISHHDIKPANLLLDARGRVKVTDFGISIISEITDNRAGSLIYSPPEMRKHAKYDPVLADVWSLGVSVYQMLMGSFPFDIHAWKQGKLIQLQPFSAIKIPEFQDLIVNCLMVNPSQRPSMQTLLDKFKSYEEKPVKPPISGNLMFRSLTSSRFNLGNNSSSNLSLQKGRKNSMVFFPKTFLV